MMTGSCSNLHFFKTSLFSLSWGFCSCKNELLCFRKFCTIQYTYYIWCLSTEKKNIRLYLVMTSLGHSLFLWEIKTALNLQDFVPRLVGYSTVINVNKTKTLKPRVLWPMLVISC